VGLERTRSNALRGIGGRGRIASRRILAADGRVLRWKVTPRGKTDDRGQVLGAAEQEEAITQIHIAGDGHDSGRRRPQKGPPIPLDAGCEIRGSWGGRMAVCPAGTLRRVRVPFLASTATNPQGSAEGAVPAGNAVSAALRHAGASLQASSKNCFHRLRKLLTSDSSRRKVLLLVHQARYRPTGPIPTAGAEKR
jgi:hypothetical protein